MAFDCPLRILLVGMMLIPALVPMKIAAPYPPQFAPHIPPTPASGSGSGLQLPKITVYNGTDLGAEFGVDVYRGSGSEELLFENETMLIVPSTRNQVTLKCTANYPIFWNLAHSKIHPYAINSVGVNSVREFKDSFDPSTFTYTSYLTLRGPMAQLTANYSCQSTARHEIQSNMFVFWQPTFGNSVFIHSKENVTVTVINPKSDEILLPCHISDPDAHPKLTKETGNSHLPPEELHLNESVHFSPAVGFSLKNLPSPLGIYKCLLDGNDYVSVHVVQKNASNPERNYIFQYDDESKQVKCCSSVKKPPKIFLMVCEHPSTCGVREHYDSSASGPVWNQGRRRGNCSILSLRTYHTGIIRCVGDGFNVFKEFIVPVRADHVPWNVKRNTTTYFRWEEIDPQEMLAVSSGGLNAMYGYEYYAIEPRLGLRELDDQTIYAKQQVSLVCHTSRFYFSSGTHWMIRWKNQTLTTRPQEVAADSQSAIDRRVGFYPGYREQAKHTDIFTLNATTDIESVICFAPVWNSSVWVTKIHYLYVNESIAPSILDEREIVKYTWYANETGKTLTCSGNGAPSPNFRWEKDNMTILASAHNYNVLVPNATESGGDAPSSQSKEADTSSKNGTEKNGTSSVSNVETAHSSLKILRVSFTTQGVYRCVATNFGGTAVKEFHITVLEAKSWTTAGILGGASVITLVLIVGIIFLLRKLLKDRQEIRQLTSVNFKDVSRQNSSASTARADDDLPSGVSFDYGKMTNNLIDTF